MRVMAKLLLGALVQDGKRNQFPTAYSGGKFGLADADGTQPIPWLVSGGTLFCCHNLLTGISWKALSQDSKVFGCKAEIEGFKFLCRIPYPGTTPGGEWDAAVDLAQGDDRILHWKNYRSWCQSAGMDSVTRVVRGGSAAKEWQSYPENGYAGWRPILEPKGVPIPESGLRLQAGYELLVWGTDCVLRGKILDQSDYDLVLQSSGTWFADDAGSLFRPLEKKLRTIIVDKSQVRMVQIGRFIGS